MQFDDPRLRQRGRASIDFLRQLILARQPLHNRVDQDLNSMNIDERSIPEDLDEAHAFLGKALDNSDAFSALNLIAEWHYRNYASIATEAFEEVEHELAPLLEKLMRGPSTLQLNPELEVPDYWEGVFFHRTQGGWDGHPHMGFIHGDLIHKKLIGELSPGGLLKQRASAAAMAPSEHYNRILDMGCSSGHYTLALAETYPNAKIVGVDLSSSMLEYALQSGNNLGLELELHQCAAEATSFNDESFDLVTSYILLHELPPDIIRSVFQEAFRLLEKGGDLLMADVPRYADMDKFSVWKTDRDAMLGGEPHWRASASLDLKTLATEAGFENIGTSGPFPYVITANKPL